MVDDEEVSQQALLLELEAESRSPSAVDAKASVSSDTNRSILKTKNGANLDE